MKKISALILSTAIIASLFSGCNKEAAPSETALTSTPASETSAVATDATDIEEPQTFEELYGDQLLNYINHQYYFDGEAIPVTETNFYFINAFLDLSGYANMGYYPATTLGFIDLSATFTGEEYETFGDYFVEYAENSIESTCILNLRAKEAGIELSDETKTAIDDMMENIKTTNAANTGMSLDEYLQFYYGPGNDEATFRKVLERYYIADAYSKDFCDNYEFTDEEKNVPYVRYALFYAPEGAPQADLDNALEAATTMKNACTTIDDLTGLAETAQANGIVYDQGDIAVPKGQMVPKFEEWAYGEGRTVGELDIIFAPEYGYFVVGYLGLQEQSKDSLDKIALNSLSESILEEVNANTHDFHTDDVYLPAPAAPTPTDVPEVTLDYGDQSFNPDATVASGDTAAQTGNMSTTDVLVVVFITLAAVAVVAVVVILIAYAMKNGKIGGNNSNNNSKPAPKKASEYDDDDEDSSSAKKNKNSNKSQSSKKKDDEEFEEDDEEESEDEDEE